MKRSAQPGIVRGGEDDSQSGNKHGGGGQGEGDDSGHSDTNGGGNGSSDDSGNSNGGSR